MNNFPPPPGLQRWPAPTRSGGIGGPRLVLTRRRPAESSALADASAAARRQIDDIVAATRAPGHVNGGVDAARAAELEKALRTLEARLAERERAVDDLEARLAEREREMAETQALLAAREKVIDASQHTARNELSSEAQAALQALKAELERQEESLREGKAALKEREVFLEESENRLFEKVQAQQEKETELEQREEDVRARERRLREREAALDPAAAAALASEDARARAFDEFNE